jgi:serine protease Do
MRKLWISGALVITLLAASLSFVFLNGEKTGLRLTTNTAIAQESSINQAITDSGQAAVQAAIAKAGPAVVRIDVTGTIDITNPFSRFLDDPFFRRFFGEPLNIPQQQEIRSVGSGVVIDYAGEKLVLTNQHVVDQANTIRVTNPDGRTWDAEVVGSDEEADIAVLRLEGNTENLAAAQLGDSSMLKIGDWVIAIGNPVGLSYTVTLGIVSALGRDMEKPTGVGFYHNLIQTDAAINPGNSGGPLVNAMGEVVGINSGIIRESAGVTIEGINFAIAINTAKDILEQLVTTGKVTRAWLGVYIQDITPSMEDKFGVKVGEGVLVSDIVTSSPAAAAGIQSGDVITKVNEQTMGSADELINTISLKPVGSLVDLEIVRKGNVIHKQVTLAERPSEQALYGGETEEDQGSTTAQQATKKFGLTVGPVTPELVQRLGLHSTQGVVIMDVAQGSRAYWAGLQAEDVVLEIDLEPVTSVEDWDEIVSKMSDDADPLFTILRDGQTRFITLGD